MKFVIASPEKIEITIGQVTLRGLAPVINGVACMDCQVEATSRRPGETRLEFRSAGWGKTRFGLDIRQEDETHARLTYWLNRCDQPLDSFGLRFTTVENLRAYLRNSYFGSDGSYYVDPVSLEEFAPYEERPETGYAMTQLLPRRGSGSALLGFERHDRFQHTFTFDTNAVPPSLTILTLWDQKTLQGPERPESEDLLVFEHPGVEGALVEWAQRVAEASPLPPRTSGAPIIGWCSWYDQYIYISEESILEYLHGAAEVVRREKLPMKIFQVDDGFLSEMGDWLEVNGKFPRGMQPLLDDIRRADFTPGLWIAPFMVGNRSRLYRDHPDWVLRRRSSGQPLVQWEQAGEFRWGKRSEEYYILDVTHPDAFEYMRQVFRTWRGKWGCEYFKIDFLFYGAAHGPDEVVYHTPGATRIETWRRFMQMVRQEIGEAPLLASVAPLWASVGLADGIRIGSDAGIAWYDAYNPDRCDPQSLLRDQASRNFANHILWQADPDCVLLRSKYHSFTDNEVRSLAIYAGMSGGVMMTSDALHELSPERLRLWKLLLSPQRRTCTYPFLGQGATTFRQQPDRLDPQRVRHEAFPSDPLLAQVRGLNAEGVGAAFLFNTGDKPLECEVSLKDLGLEAPLHVYEWTQDQSWSAPLERLALSLPPHDGRLFFVGRQPFARQPERLP